MFDDYPVDSMSDFDIRIEKTISGYELRLRDPEIVQANKDRDKNASKNGGVYPDWKDPCREFVLKDKKALLAFLDKNIDKALPADDYESSFDAAVAAANKASGDDDGA